MTSSNFKRPFFIEDPKVQTQSADWRNYKKSGYDKGHLCPAADMEFSLAAYNDTFFTSNISPQKHYFNGGIWSRLENKTRYWASKYKRIYVITGGVLESGLKTIGFEMDKFASETYSKNLGAPCHTIKIDMATEFPPWAVCPALDPIATEEEP